MEIHATTVLGVVKGGRAALAADGQVTFGQNTVIKEHAQKVHRLSEGRVLAGFAGSVADALTLFETFEKKLDARRGNLRQAAVDLAREWRTDRMLRRLEALLLVTDGASLLLLSGDGEVIEPDDGVMAIGSGGSYALAAARALIRHTDLPVETVTREALSIAADICIYTNHEIRLEVVESRGEGGSGHGR